MQIAKGPSFDLSSLILREKLLSLVLLPMEATSLASCRLGLTTTVGVISTDTLLTLGTEIGRQMECCAGMGMTASGSMTGIVSYIFTDSQ